ncbi:MAG: SBBP repeat-containing protein [Lewinellaceae bacterium]|nr:SBBP repeat-containing protein [Lewinellaceae bacterium]
MNKYTLTLLFALTMAAVGFTQPTLQWDSRFHGPIANDEGKAIAVDAAGNVYVTGASDGNTGAKDYLTIKYSAAGDTLWSRRYDGSANGEDVAIAIKVDISGNVYVTGRSWGNTTDDDMVTIKYGPSGTQQWAAVYSGTGNAKDVGYNLVVDVFGNVYVVGSSRRNSVFVKYNASGVEQWIKGNAAFYDPITSETNYLIDINVYNNIVVAIDEPDAIGNFIIQELDPFTGQTIFEYNTPFIQVYWGTPNAMALDGAGNMYLLSTSYTGSGIPTKISVARFTHGVATAAGRVTYSASSGQRISGVDLKLDAELNMYVLANYYVQGTYNYFTIRYDASDTNDAWTVLYGDPDRDNIPVGLAVKNEVNPDVFVAGYSSLGEIITVGYDSGSNPLWDPVVYDCGNNGIDNAGSGLYLVQVRNNGQSVFRKVTVAEEP